MPTGKRSVGLTKMAPCKDCPRREPACQGKCEEYKLYLDEYHKKKRFLSCKEADLYVAASKRKRRSK